MIINFCYSSMMGPQMMGDGVNQMSNTNNGFFQAIKQQYGCEDCFRKSPYPMECPIPYQPVPIKVVRPNTIKNYLSRIFLGG